MESSSHNRPCWRRTSRRLHSLFSQTKAILQTKHSHTHVHVFLYTATQTPMFMFFLLYSHSHTHFFYTTIHIHLSITQPPTLFIFHISYSSSFSCRIDYRNLKLITTIKKSKALLEDLLEFFERSCTAEFPGFLLHKELERKLKVWRRL